MTPKQVTDRPFIVSRVRDGWVLTRRATLEQAIDYAVKSKWDCRVRDLDGQRLWQNGVAYAPDQEWNDLWKVK